MTLRVTHNFEVSGLNFDINLTEVLQLAGSTKIKPTKMETFYLYIGSLPTLSFHFEKLSPLTSVAGPNFPKSKFTTRNHDHKNTLPQTVILISYSPRLKKPFYMTWYQSWNGYQFMPKKTKNGGNIFNLKSLRNSWMHNKITTFYYWICFLTSLHIFWTFLSPKSKAQNSKI